MSKITNDVKGLKLTALHDNTHQIHNLHRFADTLIFIVNMRLFSGVVPRSENCSTALWPKSLKFLKNFLI